MKKVTLLLLTLTVLAVFHSCMVENQKPSVDFSYSGVGTAPCQVTFENKTDNADSYQWDFGDGTSSTEKNPVKTYESGGTYTVTLTARGEGGSQSVSKQLEIGFPKPVVEISPAILTIYLPNNCSQSFQISNTGPEGSTLEYTVADDGVLGGFLKVENATGSIPSGGSNTITVSVIPEFVSGQSNIAGSTLVLNVYTPQASNFIKTPVTVKVLSAFEVLLGTWSGTWSGISYGGYTINNPDPQSPVNGTWTLDLQSIDTLNSTATGTLMWNGSDKYWAYVFDGNGDLINSYPVVFVPDRTIEFNSLNSTLLFPTGNSNCNQVHFTIEGFENSQNPYEFYGPRFEVLLDINSKTVSTPGGGGFLTHPYDASNLLTALSMGTVLGSKQ